MAKLLAGYVFKVTDFEEKEWTIGKEEYFGTDFDY